MNFIWGNIFGLLFLNYDTSRDFMPQFEENVAKLKKGAQMVKQVEDYFDGKAPMPEELIDYLTQREEDNG